IIFAGARSPPFFMSKLHRWYTIAIGLIIVLAGIFGAYFFKQNLPPKYLTATVVRGDLENTVIAMGTLQAFKQVDVGAQVSGQLKSLKVKLGDKVSKGQWLAEIDPIIPQNELHAAQINEEDLFAQKRSMVAQLKQATLAFQRQKRMLRHDATSHENFEAAQAT